MLAGRPRSSGGVLDLMGGSHLGGGRIMAPKGPFARERLWTSDVVHIGNLTTGRGLRSIDSSCDDRSLLGATVPDQIGFPWRWSSSVAILSFLTLSCSTASVALTSSCEAFSFAVLQLASASAARFCS